MSHDEKLRIYGRVLESCEATFADVPRQWQAMPSVSRTERQDYMLYQVDDAVRRASEIEADMDELGEEERTRLEAAKREWDQVEPILKQMEQTFPKDMERGKAA